MLDQISNADTQSHKIKEVEENPLKIPVAQYVGNADDGHVVVVLFEYVVVL